MGALIGIKPGRGRDPTGLAVVESEFRPAGRRRVDHYLVRHLERLPMGTQYPDVARRLAEILEALQERGESWPFVYVDATGLGEPVIDLIEDAVRRCRVRTVYFTHGDRCREEDRVIHLGKAYLVTRLETLLQTGQLHLPRTREAEELARDLLEYDLQIPEDANERYGAFRVGRHDDLITALGLTVHRRRRMPFILAARTAGP